MPNPTVSVCVITYNQVDFIDEALRSVLEQDYDHMEVVVGDDGSTDGTAEVVGEYARKYPGRLVALPARPHQGIYDNANRTLAACRGKYVAFLDGDDAFLPGKVKKQVEWMEADQHRVLCGHDVEVFESKTGRTLHLWSERFPLRNGRGAESIVRTGHLFPTVSVMVRASALPSYGFDWRLRVVLDWMLWVDSLASGGLYGYVDGVYGRHRIHEGGVFSGFYRNVQMIQDDHFVGLSLIESHYPQLVSSCRYRRASLLYEVGTRHLLQGERASARSYLINALRQNLLMHPKGCVALLLTLLPEPVFGPLVAKWKSKRQPS